MKRCALTFRERSAVADQLLVIEESMHHLLSETLVGKIPMPKCDRFLRLIAQVNRFRWAMVEPVPDQREYAPDFDNE